jgi:hypothetical protein
MAERIASWIIMMICGILLLVDAGMFISGSQGLSPWVLVGTGTAGVVVYFRNAGRRR